MSISNQQPLHTMNTVNYQDLIIDSPEKQAAWKRVGFFLLTLAFWGIWLYLWTPLPGLLQTVITSGFSEISFRPATYVIVFLALLFALSSWQIGWLHYNLARFRNRGRRSKKQLLSNQELGQFFTVDNNKLDYWQQSKCLVILHNETGEIEEIDVNDFFSFAPSISKAEVSEQDYQRHYVVIVPKKSRKQLFNQVGNDFVVIMKVLCTTFNLKFVISQPTKNLLFLIVDIPSGYNAENVIKQIKIASASIVQKKYDQLVSQQTGRLNLWRSEHLVTTKKLAGHEIQQIFQKLIKTKTDHVAKPKLKNTLVKEAENTGSKNSKLASEFWQNNKQLFIEHQETGTKSQIDVSDFFVCVSMPTEQKQINQERQRYFVVLLPESGQSNLFVTIGINFRIIMTVLCSMNQIELVDCHFVEHHLSLTLDMPSGYDANKFVEQLKKATAYIIFKKYHLEQDSTETFRFWRSEQLVTTPELVDVEIKQFFAEIVGK